MSTATLSITARSAQFYVESSDKSIVDFVADVMSRLLELGFQVNAILVSGLSRPKMVVGDAVYSGVAAIRAFIEQIERMLRAGLKS